MSIIVSYVNSIFFFSLYISLFYITFKVLFFLPVPIIPHFVYGDHHMMFFRGKNLCFLGEKKLYFSYAYLFWYVSLFPFSISNLLSSQGMLGFPKQAKYMNSLQIITVKFFFFLISQDLSHTEQLPSYSYSVQKAWLLILLW